MSVRSRIKSALSRAKARSKASISKRKTQSAKVRSKISTTVKSNIQKSRAKRTQQKTRATAQRKEVVATAKAVATPRQQRTPEQLERTRAVARFGLGAITAGVTGGAVGVLAKGVGKRVGAKAVARGISKKTVQRAGKLGTVGLLGTGIYGTGVQAKRIREGKAGAFETGFTLGGVGVLARPTTRVISSAKQIVRPTVTIPKVTSVVAGYGFKKDNILRGIYKIKTNIGRGKSQVSYAESLSVRKGIITSGLSKEIGQKRAKEITAFVTRDLPDKAGATADIKLAKGKKGFEPIEKPKLTFTGELIKTTPAEGVEDVVGAFAGQRGRGTFGSRTFDLNRFRKQTTDYGGGFQTKTVSKTKSTQQEKAILGEVEKSQEKAIKGFVERSKKQKRGRARTRLRSGIRQITPQVTTQIAGQATRVTARTVVDVATKVKQREDTVFRTPTITTEIPKIPTPIRTRIPTGTSTTTDFTRDTGRITGGPFIPLFRFGGGAGAGGGRQPKIGKELGGRFTRSFSAEVLGIKAPRKRKLKRKYTGFELRI